MTLDMSILALFCFKVSYINSLFVRSGRCILLSKIEERNSPSILDSSLLNLLIHNLKTIAFGIVKFKRVAI